jgi:hypothetical protein
VGVTVTDEVLALVELIGSGDAQFEDMRKTFSEPRADA